MWMQYEYVAANTDTGQGQDAGDKYGHGNEPPHLADTGTERPVAMSYGGCSDRHDHSGDQKVRAAQAQHQEVSRNPQRGISQDHQP